MDTMSFSNDAESPKITARMVAKRKWRLVSNTFKALTLLRIQDVKPVLNVDDLIEEIKSTPVKFKLKHQISLSSELIDEHKLREKLFTLVQSSTEDDIMNLKELIETHPLRYTITQSHPQSFLNKPFQDSRPIYEAARLGYTETVKLLLKHGADPHLLSGKDLSENSLDVAARWRHRSVVNVLLLHSKWTHKELKSAMTNTSDEIYKMLHGMLKDTQRKNCKCSIC